MSAIGTAFVAVRPDLTEFKAELIKKLEPALKLPVAARTIQLRASFEVGTKEKLAQQLTRMGPIPILVKPTIAPGSIEALQKKVGVLQVATVGRGTASGTSAPQRANRTADALASATAAADEATIAATKALQTQVTSLEEAEAVLTATTKALAAEQTAFNVAASNASPVVAGLRKHTKELAESRQADAAAQAQQLSLEEKLTAAQVAQAAAADKAALLPTAGAGISGAKSQAGALNKAALAAEQASAAAVAAAVETQDAALVKAVAEQDQLTAAAVAETRAKAASVLEAEKQLGIEHAIERVQALRASALTPAIGSSSLQAAKHAAQDAAKAEQAATIALKEFNTEGTVASAANLERLRTEAQLATELLSLIHI